MKSAKHVRRKMIESLPAFYCFLWGMIYQDNSGVFVFHAGVLSGFFYSS